MTIVYVTVGGGFSEKVPLVFSKSRWDLLYIYVLGDAIVSVSGLPLFALPSRNAVHMTAISISQLANWALFKRFGPIPEFC